MIDETLYEGREQTLVKHFVLNAYLERFAHIIGFWADTITYVDCFSGPWRSRSPDLRDTSFAIARDEHLCFLKADEEPFRIFARQPCATRVFSRYVQRAPPPLAGDLVSSEVDTISFLAASPFGRAARSVFTSVVAF